MQIKKEVNLMRVIYPISN